ALDVGGVPVPETEFMPDRSERPDERPPQVIEEQQAAVVPPPNAAQRPRTRTDTSRVEPFSPPDDPRSILERIWAWLRPVLVVAGPPLVLIGLVVGWILGSKARRRRRRRAAPLPANRYAGAWDELADRVHDLGEVRPALRGLPLAATRREHAATLDG